MDQIFVIKIALIGVLGVGAQWLAWRFNLPGIVLMAVAGLLAGPVFGVLDPVSDFGALLTPMISIAVAIILFEGGLTLNFREIRDVSTGVRRLVFPGAVIAWGLGALAAHYLANLDWPVALLFAGILIVTGPTVIVPLLRQAKLAQRPATLLKWEGIVNDPIGALVAVFVFQYLAATHDGEAPAVALIGLAAASAAAGAIGFLAGRLLVDAFHRGLVPEYLKAPFILCAVLAAFGVSNLLGKETGLVAVTVMGVTIANSKIGSLSELRRFKETITILLVSGVFVILTATLTPDMFAALGWPAVLFVFAMLFVVRPASVWLATIGSNLDWRERLLVGWIAPRGIVAAAVSGLFAAELQHLGYAQAEALTPLAFAVIFATVIAHGFTIGPLARRLDLSVSGQPGVLIVGASAWSARLAKLFKDLETPVTIADTDWRRLRPARLDGVDTYYGEILSEVTEHHLDLNKYGYLLAVSGNRAYNSLVCTDLAPELGRATTFQLGDADEKDEEHPHSYSFTVKGRPLFKPPIGVNQLLRRHYEGWDYKKTKLTEEYDFEAYQAELAEDAVVFLVVKKAGVLVFASAVETLKPEAGDTVIAYAPPPP